MPLEALEGPDVFITDLNPNYPTSEDDRSEGDDHIRGGKNATKNSFPNISGVVSASDAELSHVTGVTSAVQTQLNTLDGEIDANDVDIADHEGRIAALEAAPAGTPPAEHVQFTNTTVVGASYADITGAAVQVPAGWAGGQVQISAAINAVLGSGTSAGKKLLSGDFAIYVGGVFAMQFFNGIGIQAPVASAGVDPLQIAALVPVNAVVAAAGGQVITIRAKKNGTVGVDPAMTFTINSNSATSSMIISPVDLSG